MITKGTGKIHTKNFVIFIQLNYPTFLSLLSPYLCQIKLFTKYLLNLNSKIPLNFVLLYPGYKELFHSPYSLKCCHILELISTFLLCLSFHSKLSVFMHKSVLLFPIQNSVCVSWYPNLSHPFLSLPAFLPHPQHTLFCFKFQFQPAVPHPGCRGLCLV